jgi:Lipocalin-like domain
MRTSLREQMIGTWQLVSFECKGDDEVVGYPFGKDPQGTIIYSADGYVSLNIMKGGRSTYVEKDLYERSDMKYSDLPYLGYSGRYYVNEAWPSVVHDLDVCLFPEWLGPQAPKLITLKYGFLQLSSAGPTGLHERWFNSVFIRK